MAVKCSKDRYGSVAVSIHWLAALLLLVLIVSGFRAGDMEDLVAKASILRVHIPIAILVLLLTLLRIFWWWFADSKPVPVAGTTEFQDRAARLVHFLFYVVILGMLASGLGMLILSGAGPIIFGGAAETLPDFWDYKPRVPHGMGARAFMVLFVIHTGAALYHHFVKKDGVLRRMWYGSAER
jgi:cytochrome b561